ncbi:MAG: hypothetical protein ACRDMH_12225 [Solirubrobacterales bacterium]
MSLSSTVPSETAVHDDAPAVGLVELTTPPRRPPIATHSDTEGHEIAPRL